MDDEQRDRFRQALDRKEEETERREREGTSPRQGPADPGPVEEPAAGPIGTDREPDDLDVRAKNSGHGQVTADKWNQ